MPDSLPNPLPRFDDLHLLVVGDCMLDRYFFGDTQRISPEAPVPVVNITRQDHRPGGAGNVALNVASLGSKVTLVGLTGQDEAAQALSQRLQAASVVADLQKVDTLSTIIKLRVISRNQQLMRLDFEMPPQAVTHQTTLIERFKQHLPSVNLAILSDYHKGTLADPAAFIALAQAQDVPVLVDPKSNDFNIYRHASVITPNLKEFEAVVGRCHSEQAIHERGEALLKAHHFGALLLTRGEHGMTLIEPHRITHIPALAREIFDVTGAGDTVISTLGVAMAAGLDIAHAATLANTAASIVVNKLGAAAVTLPELQAALANRPQSRTGIVNREQLLQAVLLERAKGKKIVFTNGCFDIIHAGHVACLQMAKELGDYLIVAVNTDESVRKLKGPHRPINQLEHRMKVLSGFNMVDWVIPFDEPTPETLLHLLQPDILVKGGDYNPDQVVGAEIVRAYGGEVRIVTHHIQTSSSSLYQKLTHLPAEEE